MPPGMSSLEDDLAIGIRLFSVATDHDQTTSVVEYSSSLCSNKPQWSLYRFQLPDRQSSANDLPSHDGIPYSATDRRQAVDLNISWFPAE